MFSALRYRLYPDEDTRERLGSTLALCCYLYNESLAERKRRYKETGHGLYYNEQANALPAFKKENPAFTDVHSQVLQNVLKRLERSFKNFFDGRAGYPKPKNESKWRSLTYPQASPSWVRRNSIVLPKIGKVRVVKQRPVKGEVKTVTVLRTSVEEWYAVITVKRSNTDQKKEPKTAVGIDLGLTDYAHLSDGTRVENPRFIMQHDKRIVKAQRILSRRVKGSRNRWRARVTLSRRWDDYTNQKDDWQWKLAHSIVDRFDIIGYENLQVNNMVKNHRLAKAIQDASWSGFTQRLTDVAVMAGSLAVGVDPRYSTQECPECGSRIRMALSERTHICPSCGFRGQRDFASSLVIRKRALEALGLGMPEVTPMEMGPTPAAMTAMGEPCRGSGKQIPTPPTKALDGLDSGAGSLPLKG
ncbi:MAG: transposase [Nitrososphaerales archaeon]|nr:transposase [Nitrososphaerales archaeon]